jgi:sec-independent protein translocase protein TatA
MEFSLTHILILMTIALLVFGAKRIPEIGSSLGKGIREFKSSMKDMGSEQPQQLPAPPSNSPSSLPDGGDPKRLSD